MRRFVALLFVLMALSGSISLAIASEEPIVATSLENQVLQTCTSVSSHDIRILRAGSNCHLKTEALAIWRSVATPKDLTSKFPMTTLNTCEAKNSTSPKYTIIKDTCKRFQDSISWHRWVKAPTTPEIKSVEVLNESTALISLNPIIQNPDAPISFFTVTSHPDEVVTQGLPSTDGQFYVPGLIEEKTYTFTISATNADGESPVSAKSDAVTPKANLLLEPAGPGTVSLITLIVLVSLFLVYRRVKFVNYS